MQDSKSDLLTFTTNNTQTFATSYASGSTYTVSVKTQPSGQTCTLSSNASGTITSNITVTATCTTNVVNFTISVAVTGLTGTLVTQDDKADNLTFTTNSTQTFATSYASGSNYTVSVKTQPSGETCALSSNSSGTISSNLTVTATCAASNPTISVTVTGLSGTVVMTDDQGASLTFSSDGTQTFSNSYVSGSPYTVNVSTQPLTQSCVPTYSTGTITSNVTISAACATGATRALGTVSSVSTISCQGAIRNGVCQQMTVSCPGVPDVQAYVKTNSPTGTSLGTVTYNTGTDGNGLYESIFTFGSTAVQNVLNAGFTTVQIDWGTPFNVNQPDGWVLGPGGVLAAACRYATVTQWIYSNVQNNTSLPYCATGNSGGAGALAYALSQYPTSNILSMAEVTSGPPTGRLDWGCGCLQGKLAVQCGSATTLGTCFGNADAPVWDPAYNPTAATGVCKAAVNGTLPPGGLNFFLGDSAEAPGGNFNYPHTFVNVVFGGADNSSAIPIGQDWLNNITSSKGQACVPGGVHSLANTLAGAQQISNDLINNCKLQ
jgi:ribosomal protein S11